MAQLARKVGNMALVSIITPVYNASRWLQDSLRSVRDQTVADWEHLLVDDGSTDNSTAIIESVAAQDGRVRLLRTPQNSGPSTARNLAIRAANGRFIAFLDADDLWLPEKLARSIKWINTGGYPFSYHDYRYISHDGARVGPLVRAPEKLDLRTLHTQRGHGGCMSIVLDREKVKDFQFPVECQYLHEDFCAWLGMIKDGHIGRRLPEDLGRCRLSPQSRSSNKLYAAHETWRIYRDLSGLSRSRAVWWWIQYAWNGFWIHYSARPRWACKPDSAGAKIC